MRIWLKTFWHCLTHLHRRAAYIENWRVVTFCWDCFIEGQCRYASGLIDKPPFGVMYDNVRSTFRERQKAK